MNRREALQALMALPATATVSLAAVSPTDVIVIHSDEHVSAEGVAHIQAAMQQVWPNNKCVVLDKGHRLSIARNA